MAGLVPAIQADVLKTLSASASAFFCSLLVKEAPGGGGWAHELKFEGCLPSRRQSRVRANRLFQRSAGQAFGEGFALMMLVACSKCALS
jgi:hypothetical protein